MNNLPEYDIVELLLAGLFVGGALVSLIWAGSALYQGELPTFAEGAGLSLMFLGGMAHPRKYVLDCLTFPFTLISGESTGRETPLTLLAGGLGLSLWCAGFLASQFA
jgi:hypothetical protein